MTTPAHETQPLFSARRMWRACGAKALANVVVFGIAAAIFSQIGQMAWLAPTLVITAVLLSISNFLTYSRAQEKHDALLKKYGSTYEHVLHEQVAAHGLDTLIWGHWVQVEVALKRRLRAPDL